MRTALHFSAAMSWMTVGALTAYAQGQDTISAIDNFSVTRHGAKYIDMMTRAPGQAFVMTTYKGNIPAGNVPFEKGMDILFTVARPGGPETYQRSSVGI